MMLSQFLSGFVALCCFGDAPDRPPPLTFDEHVDYVAWWNEKFSEGKTNNAFPLYAGLCADAQGRGGFRRPEGTAKEQLDQIEFTVWGAKDHPDLALYLQQCTPHFDTLRKATRVKDFWQPISSDTKPLLALHLPTPRASRIASKMIIVRAWMRQENQADAITDAHRIALRTAGHMQQHGSLIGGLVGLAERSHVYRSVLSGLGVSAISGKDTKRAYEVLRKHDPGSPDWMFMLSFEWAMQLDALQYLCPDGKLNDDRWVAIMSALATASPGMNALTDPRATITLIDQHFEEMQKIAKGSPTAKKLAQLREHYDGQFSIHQKDPFMRLMNPNFSRAYELTVRTESHRRGTMLALAIHAHHAKHGKWPKSLKKIDKKLGLKGLKKLRKDPLSGKFFKYRIKDDEPLLYSIGADGNDDGGHHDPKWGEGEDGGDFVFWPRQPRRP